MEFELCDVRKGNSCSKPKGKIEITDGGINLVAPDGSTLINISTFGQVYFDPEKWGGNYRLKLLDGYEHTYELEKRC